MATESSSVPSSQPPSEPYPITAGELQAELDSLRSLRRRSLSQPTEGVNPEIVAPPSSPTSPVTGSAEHGSLADGSHSGPPASPSTPSSIPPPLSQTSSQPNESNEDKPTSSLFWVPARLHPEIAPQEFRNFIRDHSRPQSLVSGPESLGRRKSRLSQQYTPSEKDDKDDFNDDDTNSKTPSPRPLRRVSSTRQGDSQDNMDNFTIADLQRLEYLAKQAENESDQNMGSLVRRSLSLNPTHLVNAAGSSPPTAPAAPAEESDSDAPLVAHQPGSILRRSARTKVRKSSLQGDGGSTSHRFASSRRNRFGSLNVDAGKDSESTMLDRRSSPIEDDAISFTSPLTTTTSTSIVNNNITAEPIDIDTSKSTLPAANEPDSGEFEADISRALSEALNTLESASPGQSTTSKDNIENNQISPQPPPPDSRTGTPVSASSSASLTPPVNVEPTNVHPAYSRSVFGMDEMGAQRGPEASQNVGAALETPTSMPSKPKKSGWARFGLSRNTSTSSTADDEESDAAFGARKGKKDKKGKLSAEGYGSPKESQPEGKEYGFFGSLFNAKKKSEQPDSTSSSQSQTTIPPTASGMFHNGEYMNFYRLPLHIERAVYRLSHIKLANPRRPLYEQVLISNLMFWYLSVINRPPPHLQNKEQQCAISQSPATTQIPEAAAAPSSEVGPSTLAVNQGTDMGFVSSVPMERADAVRQLPFEHEPSSSGDALEKGKGPSAMDASDQDGSDQSGTASASSSSFPAIVPIPVSTRSMVSDSGFEVVRPQRRKAGIVGNKASPARSQTATGVPQSQRASPSSANSDDPTSNPKPRPSLSPQLSPKRSRENLAESSNRADVKSDYRESSALGNYSENEMDQSRQPSVNTTDKDLIPSRYSPERVSPT